MFNKGRNDEVMQAASAPRPGEKPATRSRNVSVIGPTLVFKGELSADEDLVIEGSVEGTIAHQKKNLTIGKNGRVKADIHASSVLVEGRLQGDIHSDGLVSLAKGSVVHGDVYCARLVMQDGARYTGRVDMSKQPNLSIAARADDEEAVAQSDNQTA